MLEQPEVTKLAGLYRVLLILCGVLFAVFLLTILAVRAIRRSRQMYLKPPRKPSPSDDLWQQYRLPDDLNAEGDGGDSSRKE